MERLDALCPLGGRARAAAACCDRLLGQGLRRATRAPHRARQERVPRLDRLRGRELRHRLLECFAFVGDALGFYVDAQGRESRLATATQRRNVLSLARMLGYAPRGARAAIVDLEVALDDSPRSDVLIAIGSVAATSTTADAIRFQAITAGRIAAGVMPPTTTIRAEHSTSQTQLVDVGDPRPWFELTLERAPYLDGTASVSMAGATFDEVDSLVTSEASDRHFTVAVDQRDRATLRFGDGRTGAMANGTVRIDYRTGGGRAGNVEPNTLVVLTTPLLDVRGAPVRARVRNPLRAEGGVDRETIDQIRERAPLSLRAPSRTVSREDFEIHAREVPGVARALMLTSNEDPAIEENTGILYVVPDGGGLPTPALKDAVLREIVEVYPSTLTFETRVQDAVYRVINVLARVSLRRDASGAAARDAIRARLAVMFALTLDDGSSNPAVDFGYYARRSLRAPVSDAARTDFDGLLAWSDVFDVVHDTPGVRKIASWDLLLNGASEDVRLRPEELPVLGNVALYDATTGEVLA